MEKLYQQDLLYSKMIQDQRDLFSSVQLPKQKKYNGFAQQIDELLQKISELQQELLVKNEKISNFKNEREILLQNAKLNKRPKFSDRNSFGLPDLYQPAEFRQTIKENRLRHQDQKRLQSEINDRNESFTSKTLEEQQNMTLSTIQNQNPKNKRIEQELLELKDSIHIKNQAMLNLMYRLRKIDSTFTKKEFLEYMKIVQLSSNIVGLNEQLSQVTLIDGQVQQQGERYLNIYQAEEEIIGFVISQKILNNSFIVASTQINGYINEIIFKHLNGKCLQIIVSSLDDQNSSQKIIYPQTTPQEQLNDFRISKYILEDDGKSIEQIWFHELGVDNILQADITFKLPLIVETQKIGRQTQEIQLSKQTKVKILKDSFSESKKNLILHDLIIQTGQKKTIYGVQGIYSDGQDYFYGKSLNLYNDEQSINDTLNSQQSKTKVLSSFVTYTNEQTKILEKIVLNYSTQNFKNTTKTSLSLNIGDTQQDQIYLKNQIVIKQNQFLMAEFSQMGNQTYLSFLNLK